MITVPMPRCLRLSVQPEVLDSLIDDLHAYVTDPRPGRNDHHQALLSEIVGPGTLEMPRAIFEAMMLDGVRHREDVAAFVSFCAASCVAATAANTQWSGRGFTRREAEIIRLLAAGCSNQQIADELVLSICTVKRHVGNVFTKLGVSSRAAAAAFAIRQGLA